MNKINKIRIQTGIIFFFAIFLTGCAAGPDFQRPSPPDTDHYISDFVPAKTVSAPTGSVDMQYVIETEKIYQDWWTELGSDKLNTLIHDFTLEHGAVPAPLGYRGFPKSTCVSVNDEVCHGIPGSRILAEGDIVNVDVTSIVNGWFADANRTFAVGEISSEARRLVEVARQCLALGINVVRPGATLGDMGHAIQSHAEAAGYSVVRELVGHGVGHAFHEQPQVNHTGRPGLGVVLIPGMVFTIEPMINQGDMAIRRLDDGWTVVTADGALSAQFEQTVLVTDKGVRSLTPYPL